jgi:hypothetical protein
MTVFTRTNALAYRLRVNHLAADRLPRRDLTVAAHSGLQDGSPRSGLLSLAARVEGVQAEDWRAAGLAQVFGPRGAIYVVPEGDVAVFTCGLLPRDPARVGRLEETAALVHELLAGSPMSQSLVVQALPDIGGTRALRWAAAVGTLIPTWDTVDTVVHPVSPPHLDPEEARLELARRFFRYLGPATVSDLQWWLDGQRRDAAATVAALGDELVAVNVEGRESLASATTHPHFDGEPDPNQVHLLPPDDVYISRVHRRLLVPKPTMQKRLWPQAPPPGALIIGGEVAGTWRRRSGHVEIDPWHDIAERHRDRAIEIAENWPIHTDGGGVVMRWLDRS